LGKKNGYSYKYGTFSGRNTTKTNNIISKELYVNDSREGISYYYFPNGKLKEIVLFKNNKRHGVSKEFNEDSTLISINEYFNDFLIERQPLNRINDNKPVGIWREYYSNGKLKSEKNFKEGELNGYVRDYDNNGNLTNTQFFRDGKIQLIKDEDTLEIEERITYFPDKKVKSRYYFKKNLPIGIHRDYDENGNVISTSVYDNNGILTGKGIIKDDGSREGDFTYFYEDGSIKSQGLYQNNRQNGKWNFYFKNGSFEQIGNFDNGYLTGEWKWYNPDSSLLRSETFVKGKRNGLFYELNTKKDTIEKGYYLDGLKQGMWYMNSGDVVERGKFVNDLKEGIWKAWYSNGALMYEGNFIKGFPDGKHMYYYENKSIKEEQFYVNGIKEKNWKKYNEDGSLFITITYQSDMETRVNEVKISIIRQN
jgi:antitoxin component YwqK of YwqJK toxin-antitoxin module